MARRRAAWERLERLTGALGRRQHADLRDFPRLYRAAAADLAYARRVFGDHPVVAYLNRLVARAHARLYRTPPTEPRALLAFLGRGLPARVRAEWPAVALAAALFGAGAVVGLTLRGAAPQSLPLGGGPASAPASGDMAAWSSLILTNNLRVAALALGAGIFVGLGTAYILVANGLVLGGLAGALGTGDGAAVFWSLILPHGVLELPAIFIAGGAGLLIGRALVGPVSVSRLQALSHYGLRAGRLALACVPLLGVAALVEGFFTTLPLAPGVKLGAAALLGVLLLAYLLGLPVRRAR